jgi:predicted DNA-binding transcriptional regulator AlpA
MTPAVPARAPLAVVPSLDAIAADPRRAADLPPAVARALLARCVVVQSALLVSALAGDVPQRELAAPPTEALLDVEAAANRLGVSTSWLYRRAARLPFTVRIGGRFRFDPRGLARYVADRTGRGA